jgi:hypothetical protein
LILERITLNSIKKVQDYRINVHNKDIEKLLINKLWEGENTMRIFSYENVDASVERGKFSLAKQEIPIGDLVGDGFIEGKVLYWDDPYWSHRFGRTCVFNNDAKPYELFLKGGEEIDYKQTEFNIISKIAMRNVLNTMGIEIELFTDADVYLLPSRDKFACGFSRMANRKEAVKLRYEGGWVTYYMDHVLFQQILPPEEYNRINSHDPNHAGIDGIENKYPLFNREEFITKWVEEICKIIGETLRETIEVIY